MVAGHRRVCIETNRTTHNWKIKWRTGTTGYWVECCKKNNLMCMTLKCSLFIFIRTIQKIIEIVNLQLTNIGISLLVRLIHRGTCTNRRINSWTSICTECRRNMHHRCRHCLNRKNYTKRYNVEPEKILPNKHTIM